MSCATNSDDTMKLDYYQPSAACCPLVMQYEQVLAEGENISVVDRHIPSGYASLVFNSSGRAAVHAEILVPLPAHFMVVPLFRAVNIGIYEDLDSFIVTCRASVLSRLLHLNLTQGKQSYYYQLRGDAFQCVAEQFRVHLSAVERMGIIERFFLNNGLVSYQEDDIDRLYNQIMNGQGSASIAGHVEMFDKSPRYFRQHFMWRVGVNAKTLARIVRVNRLWSMILKDSAVDYQDMVFEGDYFDQAHLIHDFKKIVGETPSFFFKRNLDYVRIISGKV